jgi:hypothetical protein
MANPKLRRIFAGSGWLMVAACTTAIGLKYGARNWEAQNDTLLKWVIVVCLGGAVAAGIIYFATNDSNGDSRPIQPLQVKQSAGRDNSGKMISHVEHYHEASVSLAPTPTRQIEAPPQPRVPSRIDPLEPFPRLSLGFVDRVKIDRDGQVFQFSDQGENGLSLSVLNVPAPQAGFASDLSSVFAMLTFDQAGRRSTIINRACWIGHEANEIPIEVGGTTHILVGFSLEPCWLSFHNPNKYGYDVVEWNYRMSDLEARTIDWTNWEPVLVDVRIISTAQASKGQTIAHRKFQLRREGISYSAQWMT